VSEIESGTEAVAEKMARGVHDMTWALGAIGDRLGFTGPIAIAVVTQLLANLVSTAVDPAQRVAIADRIGEELRADAARSLI
jgi:uncharacterized protein (UPF0254 family)